MTQTYTGGDITKVTGNASAYVTHGGTDMGLLSPELTLQLPDAVEVLRFAQSKLPYAFRTAEDDPPFVSGNIAQVTQALMLKLIQGGVDDSGNAVGFDGNVGNTLTTGAGWTYFLHNVASLPKRLWFPKASIHLDGDISIGSAADMFMAPFRMVGQIDNSQSTGEKLYKLYYTEDATLVTITPSPADAATSVAVDATITLTFSEAVGEDFQQTGATGPYIYLIDTSDGTTAATSISWNTAGTVATIAHGDFSTSTTYNIIVSPEVRSATGKRIAGDGSTTNTAFISNFATTS